MELRRCFPIGRFRYCLAAVLLSSIGSLGFAEGDWKTSATRAFDKSTSQVQEIDIKVTGKYEPDKISVEAGIPVILRMHRKDSGKCAEVFEIPEYNIRKILPGNQTTQVTFTPTRLGTVKFHCGMNMMRGEILVTPQE